MPTMAQPATPLFGVDVSNNEFGGPDNPDLGPIPGFVNQTLTEGFSFIEWKCSQGGGPTAFIDPTYATGASACQSAGILHIPYHYADTSDPTAQADNCANAIAGTSTSVMIDFEDVDNNGAPLLNIGDFWNLVNALNSVGLNVALGYIPQFYFADIGRPDLSALASNGIALISADFVDGSGYASVLYPGNNAPGWSPYGGASPTIYQFTDQGIVAGNNEIDCDAYLGTLPELQQLLTGSLATTQARRRKRLQRRR